MIDLVNRHVSFGVEPTVTVNLNNPVIRYEKNPILTPRIVNQIWTDPACQVKTVHNAGITVYDNDVIMLFRSHLRCGKSVLGVARSANGIDGWIIDPQPALKSANDSDSFAPGVNKAALIENEGGGVEDPRITRCDDWYLITYSAYHAQIKNRVRVSLAATKDFRHFVRYGPVLDQDMRNVAIFPEKIDGKYAALFRPNDSTPGDTGGVYTQIRIGYSENWQSKQWNVEKKPLFETAGGPSAFSDKIGPGAVPLKTEHGWISLFHGVRTTMDGNPYVLGVALHDLNDPAQIAVSRIPVLFPSKADCRVEESDYIHVPQVVFTCGALLKENGTVLVYYGGNDTVMNVGVTHKDVLIALCKRYSL